MTDVWGVVAAIGTAVAALIAIAALVLSIVNFVQAIETRVRWEVESETVQSGVHRARIVNRSNRWAATVFAIDDTYPLPAGQPVALVEVPRLPLGIEPGNWLPVEVFQYDYRPQVRVAIYWHQRKLASNRARKRRHSAFLFV